MKAIMTRSLKDYFKNPVFWVGLILMIAAVYQCLSPYLKIHYFSTDQEIQDISVSVLTDADIMDGYVPSTPKQQYALGVETIRQSLIEDMELTGEEAGQIVRQLNQMDMETAVQYLESIGYSGARYMFEDAAYHQGNAQEVNHYIEEKLQNEPFSYYFARKFADFGGLMMAFFALVLLPFLFFWDTRKDLYAFLHTKPVRDSRYILGKLGGGLGMLLSALLLLNLVFGTICGIHAAKEGFSFSAFDFILASCIYILPNMLMMVCAYAVAALLFKNPLPAVPLLFLYIIYSNLGSAGPDGNFGYYGRPLAIVVRFPGKFFDTAAPPIFLLNLVFLLIASGVLIMAAVALWKRRRFY